MNASLYILSLSVLINQFVPPTFFLCFTFTGINFRVMLHHVCDLPLTKTYADQSEIVNVRAQIDKSTLFLVDKSMT